MFFFKYDIIDFFYMVHEKPIKTKICLQLFQINDVVGDERIATKFDKLVVFTRMDSLTLSQDFVHVLQKVWGSFLAIVGDWSTEIKIFYNTVWKLGYFVDSF